MSWFERFRKQRKPTKKEGSLTIPEGLWKKCPECRETFYRKELEENLYVCLSCNYHFPINVETRLSYLLDNYKELSAGIYPIDPLRFKDTKSYKERLREYQRKTGKPDAAVLVHGQMFDIEVICIILDYSFMGGSMGAVVGEKVTRGAEISLAMRVPFIAVSASGGARMQEGVISLMQMAKISCAIAKLKKAALPYISILTHPTTGGVTASFAMQGDILIAEPGALIGFAGPRVIQQTIKQELPEGFQKSEFLLEHGFLDIVVERSKLKDTIYTILTHLFKQDPPKC